MTAAGADTRYIHGYTSTEQQRLRKQARVAEHAIFRNIDFSAARELLEVGCGVGAQTEILLRRFPELHVTGVDLSAEQLAAAEANLAAQPWCAGRYRLQQADATRLPFDSHRFDGAFLCWILEHVPRPQQVLSEVRRVLRPGSTIYVNEVLNSSFFLDPYSPNLQKYWMAFNDFQYEHGGDPFVGAKLGNLLLTVGYQQVETEIKTFHFDNRQPDRRRDMIAFWEELLLSGAAQLIDAGCVSTEVVDGMRAELEAVQADPNAVFFFAFVQARARVF